MGVVNRLRATGGSTCVQNGGYCVAFDDREVLILGELAVGRGVGVTACTEANDAYD